MYSKLLDHPPGSPWVASCNKNHKITERGSRKYTEILAQILIPPWTMQRPIKTISAVKTIPAWSYNAIREMTDIAMILAILLITWLNTLLHNDPWAYSTRRCPSQGFDGPSRHAEWGINICVRKCLSQRLCKRYI